MNSIQNKREKKEFKKEREGKNTKSIAGKKKYRNEMKWNVMFYEHESPEQFNRILFKLVDLQIHKMENINSNVNTLCVDFRLPFSQMNVVLASIWGIAVHMHHSIQLNWIANINGISARGWIFAKMICVQCVWMYFDFNLCPTTVARYLCHYTGRFKFKTSQRDLSITFLIIDQGNLEISSYWSTTTTTVDLLSMGNPLQHMPNHISINAQFCSIQ